jgi:hypothetical protein
VDATNIALSADSSPGNFWFLYSLWLWGFCLFFKYHPLKIQRSANFCTI